MDCRFDNSMMINVTFSNFDKYTLVYKIFLFLGNLH